MYARYCLLIFALMFAGCATTVEPELTLPEPDPAPILDTQAEPDPPPPPPAWIIRGAGLFQDETTDTAAFWAIGDSETEHNAPQAGTPADDDARNELARVVEPFTHRLVEAMRDSRTPELADRVQTNAMMLLLDMEIVERWQDPDSGMHYSLARLDLSKLQDRLLTMSGIPEPQQNRLVQTVEREYAALKWEQERTLVLGQMGMGYDPETHRIFQH